MFKLSDKNKSVYKLKNFGPVYYLNLDGQPERRQYMEEQCKPRPVADDLIYNSGNTYSIPLLLYRIELGSSIHPEHIDAFHRGNYNALSQFWEQNGAGIDIKDYMNYDPYLGRITENSAAQPPPQG
jgi:hypothetical protein